MRPVLFLLFVILIITVSITREYFGCFLVKAVFLLTKVIQLLLFFWLFNEQVFISVTFELEECLLVIKKGVFEFLSLISFFIIWGATRLHWQVIIYTHYVSLTNDKRQLPGIFKVHHGATSLKLKVGASTSELYNWLVCKSAWLMNARRWFPLKHVFLKVPPRYIEPRESLLNISILIAEILIWIKLAFGHLPYLLSKQLLQFVIINPT